MNDESRKDGSECKRVPSHGTQIRRIHPPLTRWASQMPPPSRASFGTQWLAGWGPGIRGLPHPCRTWFSEQQGGNL